MNAENPATTAMVPPVISEAVILMAGSGTRLRIGGEASHKSLLRIAGRPLISYVLAALAHAGIKVVYGVVGYEGDSLISQLASLVPSQLDLRFVKNPEWQKQNGISVLAAASEVRAPFLLTMSDHLFDPAILDSLLRGSVDDCLNLAIDRKVGAIFDLDDAMKVETSGDRIVAIGKDLPRYDAIDTGVFICPPSLFHYLEAAKQNGDCSLADGVRAMAREGAARVVDIGAAWWQDIDTPTMLAWAEEHLGRDLATPRMAAKQRESV
ncbi:MAG: NTP transferase domain-containing protein [Verrucomicrobiota bacterium]